MDQVTEADVVRLGKLVSYVHSSPLLRGALSLDDDDVRQECAAQACNALSRFRALQQQSSKRREITARGWSRASLSVEEMKYVRIAIRNHMRSLVRRAKTTTRRPDDAAWGSLLTSVDGTFDAGAAHAPSPQDVYLGQEREHCFAGAIHALRDQLGGDRMALIQARVDGVPLHNLDGNVAAVQKRVERARETARRILGAPTFNMLEARLLEDGDMALEIKDIGTETLARVALVHGREVDSLDRDKLVALVTEVNTNPDTNEVISFPSCFGRDYDAKDNDCVQVCDFNAECAVVLGAASPDGTAKAAFRDARIEERLVQLTRKSEPKAPPAAASKPAAKAKPAVKEIVPDAGGNAKLVELPAELPQPPKKERPKVVAKKPAAEHKATPSPAKAAAKAKQAAVEQLFGAAPEQLPIPGTELPADAPPAPVVDEKKPTKSEKKGVVTVLAVGQVWKPNDKEDARTLVVAEIGPEVVVVENVKTRKTSTIRRAAFGDGTKKGYRFLGKTAKTNAQLEAERLAKDAEKKAAQKQKAAAAAAEKQKQPKRTRRETPYASKAPKIVPVDKAPEIKDPRYVPLSTRRGVLPDGSKGYKLKPNGQRWFRLPQGSAAELARLPVGTVVERVYDGKLYRAKKIKDGRVTVDRVTKEERKRDGEWRLFEVWTLDENGKRKAKAAHKEHEGSLNQITRFITGSNAWSGARFFSILPPQLDPASDKFDPKKFKPSSPYRYSTGDAA